VKVAVKKLSQTGDFSDVQFGDELKCLQRVKHKNIVRCLGYCSDTIKEAMPYKGKMVMAEDRRKYICFEYAPNQSLLEFLKGKNYIYIYTPTLPVPG
jgi:serine/threonine protein kinase